MTNHPNRNWRARMRAAADAWMQTEDARALYELPVYDASKLHHRIRHAYEHGYRDGRKEKPQGPARYT